MTAAVSLPRSPAGYFPFFLLCRLSWNALPLIGHAATGSHVGHPGVLTLTTLTALHAARCSLTVRISSQRLTSHTRTPWFNLFAARAVMHGVSADLPAVSTLHRPHHAGPQ